MLEIFMLLSKASGPATTPCATGPPPLSCTISPTSRPGNPAQDVKRIAEIRWGAGILYLAIPRPPNMLVQYAMQTP